MLVLFYSDRRFLFLFFYASLTPMSVMTGLFNWKVCSVNKTPFFFFKVIISLELYQDVEKKQKRLLVLCTTNVF